MSYLYEASVQATGPSEEADELHGGMPKPRIIDDDYVF